MRQAATSTILQLIHFTYDLNVNKETIRPYDSNWPSNAKEVLVIVWDKNRMNNPLFAGAEAGCVAQNVYMAASSLNLGTCVVATINNNAIGNALKLGSNLTPLFVMPVSYPLSNYPAATPDYSKMAGNLPRVEINSATFEDAVNSMVFAQQLSSSQLTEQELSQILWASYGYSNTGHRTTPRANNIYPLVVYVSDATGVYRYNPNSHSITEIQSGDKRSDIANTFSGQTWAADAPAIFVIGYDTSITGTDGGIISHMYMEVNTGCVIQQILLETSALDLQANMLSDGLADWNGAGAQQLRSIMGLSSSIIPLYAVPVRVEEGVDTSSPSITNLSQQPEAGSVDPSQVVTVSADVTNESGIKQVILSYSTDDMQTWTDVTMTASSGSTYTGQIAGFEEGKQVQYKIVAYYNNNNMAVEDNAGHYYVYTVIPVFQDYLILVFFISTATIALLARKRISQ